MVAILGLAVLSGCPPQQPPTAATTTQPALASRPAAEIPPQALVHLADLTPPVEKPVNPSPASEVSDRAKPFVADAQRLLDARDYAGAISPLERAIGYDTKNPRVLRLLGLAYVGLGDRGRAEDNLKKAVEQVPDDLEAQVLLANLLSSAQKPKEATLAYRRALQCTGAEPNEPLAAEALLNLGALLEQQSCWTAASECYAKLSGWLDPPPRRYAERPFLQQLMLHPERMMIRRGTVLLLLRRPREAEQFLRGAHGYNRTDTAIAAMLIRCLVDLKDFSGAEAALQRLIGDLAEPELSRFVPAMAEELARASGNPTLPSRLWRATPRKIQGDSMLALALAQSCQRLGANDAAIEILQSVFQAMPENVAMARELAELAAKVGRPEQALTILVKTLAASESAEPAVLQALRRLSRSMPAGLEDQLAQRPPADPNEAVAYHYAVGRLAHLRHNLTLAAAEYQKAIDAKKDFRPARQGLLETLLDQGRYAQAREQLADLAQRVDPWFADYLRGTVELAEGKLDKGIAALQKSLAANDRHVPTLELLAEADRRQGLTGEALRHLEAALRLPGDKMEVYRRRFPILLEQRQFRQAESELDALRREDPDNLDIGVMTAELQLRSGQRERADKTIAELKQKYPDSPEVMVLGLRLELGPVTGVLTKADLDRCRKRLDETLQRDPHNAMARKFLVEACLLGARYSEAAVIARRLHEDDLQDPEIGRLAARAALGARQLPQAEQVLEGILRVAPGDPFARQTLLSVLEREKKFDRAISLTEPWLAQADQDSQKELFRLRLLRLYEETKAYDKALKLLDEWARSADAQTQLRIKGDRLRYLVRLDKIDEALQATKELYGTFGEDRSRLILVGALEQAKKSDRALQLLDEWIGKRTDANVDSYRAARLLTLADANRIDQVRSAALEWIQASPLADTPHEILISALLKMEQYPEALLLLEGWQVKLSAATQPATTAPAIGAAPAPAQAERDREDAQELLEWCRHRTVQVLVLGDKYPEALKLIDLRLSIDANSIDMLNLKNVCLSEMGKKKEAIECLEQAWKLTPFEPGALNNLGYCLADLGMDLERSEAMIRRSLAVQRELNVLDSLGWVLYKKGSLREAAFVFENSLRQEEDKPPRVDGEEPRPISCVIYDHAGDVFWRLGWDDRAMEYWKAALDSAGKEKRHDPEGREVLLRTPKKIQALQAGKTPPVAPLGEGVKEEEKR